MGGKKEDFRNVITRKGKNEGEQRSIPGEGKKEKKAILFLQTKDQRYLELGKKKETSSALKGPAGVKEGAHCRGKRGSPFDEGRDRPGRGTKPDPDILAGRGGGEKERFAATLRSRRKRDNSTEG